MQTSGRTSPTTITHWTLIVRAQGSGAHAKRAMGELLMRHRRFVIWFMGYLGHPPDQTTDDLFQEFALNVVRRGDVARLRKDGCLSAWLKLSVRWFLGNEWDKWRTRRRFELVPFEPYHLATPEDQVVDAAFCADTFSAALALARARSPDPERFDRLVRFLPGRSMDLVTLGPLAGELGMKEGHLRKAIYDERRRFRACLDEVILDGLDLGDGPHYDPAERQRLLAEAKQALLRALRSPPNGVILKFDPDSP